MNFMKDNKKLFILFLVLILTGGGAYYFTSILSSQLEMLSKLKEQNIVKEKQLKFLTEQLKTLPKKQNQLKGMQMEINSINNQIPSYHISAMMTMEIMQYMDIYNFENTQVKTGQTLRLEEDKHDFYFTIPITINYTTTYDKTIQFIEELNRSSVMMTVESLTIDNSIQERESKNTTQVTPSDWVEVEIVLSLYYQEQGEILGYPNYMDFFNKENNVFLSTENDEDSLTDQLPADDQKLISQQVDENTLFDLNLADIYRSGDNYSFSAYSPDQDLVYVGITSGVDAKLSLTIKDNSYTYVIEDAEGKRSQKTVDIPVKNPAINITSQIQKISKDMPVISIYVYNETQNVIDVKMRGSELQNILIYNENGTFVPPGKRVGKIALKI